MVKIALALCFNCNLFILKYNTIFSVNLSNYINYIFKQFSDPGIIPRKSILELSDQNTHFISKEETKIEGTGGCPDKRKKKY